MGTWATRTTTLQKLQYEFHHLRHQSLALDFNTPFAAPSARPQCRWAVPGDAETCLDSETARRETRVGLELHRSGSVLYPVAVSWATGGSNEREQPPLSPTPRNGGSSFSGNRGPVFERLVMRAETARPRPTSPWPCFGSRCRGRGWPPKRQRVCRCSDATRLSARARIWHCERPARLLRGVVKRAAVDLLRPDGVRHRRPGSSAAPHRRPLLGSSPAST